MSIVVDIPNLRLPDSEVEFLRSETEKLVHEFPQIPTAGDEQSMEQRKMLTSRIFEQIGDRALGASLNIAGEFGRHNVPAVVIETGYEGTGATDVELIISGRMALLGLAKTIGEIRPSEYEDGGDHVGLVIPRPEARKQVSSNGSEVELRPHQEVTQIFDDSGRLAKVELYKSVLLHCVRDAEQPTPSRILSVPNMLQHLSVEERAILASPRFEFKAFDIVSANDQTEREKYIYAPLYDSNATMLDLDDTIGLDEEAQKVVKRMQDMASSPEFVAQLPINPGAVIAINNPYALHGRGVIPFEGTVVGKERLLQRTQIA